MIIAIAVAGVCGNHPKDVDWSGAYGEPNLLDLLGQRLGPRFDKGLGFVALGVYLVHLLILWTLSVAPRQHLDESIDYTGRNVWFLGLFVLLTVLHLSVFAGGRMSGRAATAIAAVAAGARDRRAGPARRRALRQQQRLVHPRRGRAGDRASGRCSPTGSTTAHRHQQRQGVARGRGLGSARDRGLGGAAVHHQHRHRRGELAQRHGPRCRRPGQPGRGGRQGRARADDDGPHQRAEHRRLRGHRRHHPPRRPGDARRHHGHRAAPAPSR